MNTIKSNYRCKKYYFAVFVLAASLLGNLSLSAQERVYVSTDKDCYLAGEGVWCSVYCMDKEENGSLKYSPVSSVAYLEFYSLEGLVSTIKVALIDGRGSGRFDIPFTIPTGNYSIVAFTKRNGGDSKEEFKGKIITVFNTLTNERVKNGVEILDKDEDVSVKNTSRTKSPQAAVELPRKSFKPGEMIPFQLHNLGNDTLSLNISVYHVDRVTNLIGENGYDTSYLLDRCGTFNRTGEVDYEGEVIKGRIVLKNPGEKDTVNLTGKNVYMTAMGKMDDVYIASADSKGHVVYYTNNIYGQRDLVFDVAGNINVAKVSGGVDADTSLACSVEIINDAYKHKPAAIPVLKISPALSGALSERGVNMQIAKRFEADTLFDLLKMRPDPLLDAVTPIVYNLDEYTRFPVMEEVVREFVKELRIRRYEKSTDFQILWEEARNSLVYSKGYTLALLDGVPIRDHAMLVKFDPLLVRQIVIYPRQFVIGNFVYDGIVAFNTYKGDMGGMKLSRNISIVNYKGVQYPLAFSGKTVAESGRYPNYNETIYWNPIVTVNPGKSFVFDCLMPAYQGDFKIVIEGVDASGKNIYYTTGFSVE